MAKIKVKKTNLNKNLMGETFNSPINQTIFSLGKFSIQSNFEGAESGVNYGENIGGFSKPITLETLNLDEKTSELLEKKNRGYELNLDYSELGSFVRFGSTREYLRGCVEKIITIYPAGVFMNSMKNRGGNLTVYDYNFDEDTNISSFRIPSDSIDNSYELIIDKDNNELINNNILSNINKSFNEFALTTQNDIYTEYYLISYIGDSDTKPFLDVEIEGNPFPELSDGENGRINYHIKPKKKHYDYFKLSLVDFEKHIVGKRDGLNGFYFDVKIPQDQESGKIVYGRSSLMWSTSDGYNPDISGPTYNNFLNALINIGSAYDSIKTDLIYNLLVPKSILNYDLTEEKKMSKLLRIYGKQVDRIRVFIDSLAYIHNLSYDKINNAPDKLLNNIARTFGWKDLFIKTEEDFVSKVFSPVEIDNVLYSKNPLMLSTNSENNSNINTEEVNFEEINIELWRRLLINTNYFWNAKGTRHSIITILRMLGLPEEFINFNEFIYTADAKINPNNVTLELDDFPTNSLSYDEDGFPKTPLESPDFFFQISGITDNGQRYMDVFRKVGFNIHPEVDKIKIAIPDKNNYVKERDIDNRLIINTKVVEINIDPAKALEYDFYDYIVGVDYPASQEEFTVSVAYITIVPEQKSEYVFELPSYYNPDVTDVNVRFNGVHLDSFEVVKYAEHEDFEDNSLDYVIGTKDEKIKIKTLDPGIGEEDIVKITLLSKEDLPESISEEINVEYVVERVELNFINDVQIKLSNKLSKDRKGDVQIILGSMKTGGIVLTEKKSGANFGDYEFIDDETIRILNEDLIEFLQETQPKYILLSYITHDIQNEEDGVLKLKNESVKWSNMNTPKLKKIIHEGQQRYALRLNYAIPESKNVKILLDGLTLKPYLEKEYLEDSDWDYKINENDKYEVIINTSMLTNNSIISAYYLIGDLAYTTIIDGIDGDETFIEFMGKLMAFLIDVRTRKTITDHSGGWYPLLFRYYVEYIIRGDLPDESMLRSKGYVFNDLYNFLKKYNLAISTFMGFVKQLLPATAILKKDNLLIRNTVFTRQKLAYKRGVYFNENVYWIGDDGSYFKKEYTPELSEWVNEFIIPQYDPETDSGYYGAIDNLISGNDLTDLIFNETPLGEENEDFNDEWLKFYNKGKYLFIAKKGIRHNVSWSYLYNNGLIFGVDGFGPYNNGIFINQNKIIKIDNEGSPYNGLYFKVRLLTGGNNDPATEGGGEWNELMYRISGENGDWANFDDVDIHVDQDLGSWCQETSMVNKDEKLIRGVSNIDDFGFSNKNENKDWRPVLELIPPWE